MEWTRDVKIALRIIADEAVVENECPFVGTHLLRRIIAFAWYVENGELAVAVPDGYRADSSAQ